MEVKIKQGEKMIDATIEMIDGVMVVSPKEVKIDVTQFNDGDVITCGHDAFHWTCILRGEIEYIIDNMFIEDYCGINSDGTYYLEPSDSDSATWVRYATEEDKKLLFDKLAKEGLEWNAGTKKLVKIKWKPKEEEIFYFPIFSDVLGGFVTDYEEYYETRFMSIERGWHFKTEQECQEFCNRLNEAISQVEP